MPRPNRALTLPFALAAALALAPGLITHSARADADAAGPFPASLPTRADLAHTFLRFERAYATFQRSAEATLEFNRGFDAATRMFFSGDLSRPLRQIDSLSLRALGASANVDASIAISLAARIEPAVHHIRAGGPAPELVITSRYIAAPEDRRPGRVHLTLRLLNADGDSWESPVEAPIDDAGRISLRRPLDAPAAFLRPGQLRIELRTREGLDIDAGHWSIVDRDLRQTHAANRARLDAIENGPSHFLQALQACRDRNELLALPPDTQQSARYLLDPHELMQSLDQEIAALERAENPYKQRPGRIWRTLSIENARMPLTVYAPPRPADDEPPPLVIALHGAGGEETMFFEAYGAGLIQQLADEHGFIVAAPLTTTFVSTPAWFDLLVDTMAAEHNIDRTRVYMVGHSLGAMTASAVARMRPDDVAAICCIAGGFFNQSDDPPPTLLIPAEFDPIVPASRMLPGAAAARDRGADIEIRLAEGQGHTLLVADVLPEAIQWLLNRTTPR